MRGMSEPEMEEYRRSLSAREKKVLEIAREHLGSSFDLGRSIGFTEWQASRTHTDTSAAGPPARPRRKRRLIRKAGTVKPPSS